MASDRAPTRLSNVAPRFYHDVRAGAEAEESSVPSIEPGATHPICRFVQSPEPEPQPMSEVRNNAAQHRFELDVDGEQAVAYYRMTPGVITFVHTEVPQALSGRGIGTKLIHDALEMVRTQGLKVVPQCPFVSAFMGKHPEYNDLLH